MQLHINPWHINKTTWWALSIFQCVSAASDIFPCSVAEHIFRYSVTASTQNSMFAERWNMITKVTGDTFESNARYIWTSTQYEDRIRLWGINDVWEEVGCPSKGKEGKKCAKRVLQRPCSSQPCPALGKPALGFPPMIWQSAGKWGHCRDRALEIKQEKTPLSACISTTLGHACIFSYMWGIIFICVCAHMCVQVPGPVCRLDVSVSDACVSAGVGVSSQEKKNAQSVPACPPGENQRQFWPRVMRKAVTSYKSHVHRLKTEN